MAIHSTFNHPESPINNPRAVTPPIRITTHSTVTATKPPGIFTPFSCDGLGDYSELNWETIDGGPVMSHPMVQGVSNSQEPVSTKMPSTFHIKTSGPEVWHQPTDSSTHEASPNPIVIRDFWASLLPLLETVDYFVRDAMRLKRPTVASTVAPSAKPLEMTWLRDRYMTKIFDTELPIYPDFQFSEHVNLFLKHVNTPEFKTELTQAFTATGIHTPRDRKVVEQMVFKLFRSLATNICADGHSAAFKKLCSDRQGNIQRNIKNYCGYVDAILAQNLVLQVLRIDLEYTPAAVQGLSIDQARNDIKRFRNNQRHKKLFAGQKGFIWKMENGDRRGLHFHLILFFVGTEAAQPQFLAKQIGEYWVQVTGLRGSYQDSSQSIYPYKRLGVGMLGQNDLQRRTDLYRVVTYLCKRDQALSVKGVPTIHRGSVK